MSDTASEDSFSNGAGDARGAWWAPFQPYLRVMLDVQIDPRLRGKADLSGVLQQTVWEAHQAGGLRDASAAEQMAWLRRALENNLTDEVRKLRSEKRDVGREIDPAGDESFDRLALLVHPCSSPSAPARREETALRLCRALEKLPSAQREAIVLQHWHDRSLAEIAEHLGRTRAAVAGLLKRALEQLREELRDGN